MTRKTWVSATAGILAWFAAGCAVAAPQFSFSKTTVLAGARLFAEHCSACHSVGSLRYNRLAALGMSKADIEKEIMLPNGANYLRGMEPAMDVADATKWFGIPPPNLSHMVRARGQKWIYAYLTSFYWDPARPSGWNNHVFPNAAMPDILAPWGGTYASDGKLLQPGLESPAVYHQQVAEIVDFLRYASDPSIFERHAIGPYVLGALVLLTLFAYLLKREYWKDVYNRGNGKQARGPKQG